MATDIPIISLPVLAPGSIQGDDVVPLVDVHDLTDPGGTTKQATVDGLGYYVIPHSGRTVTNLKTYLANNAVFNVKDFGALGDGTTDDTAAFRACATACQALAGPYVFYIPRMDTAGAGYKITDEIILPPINGMAVIGDGMSASVVVQATAGKRGLVADASGLGAINRAIFRDFCISSSSSFTDGLYLKQIDRSFVQNVKAEGGTSSGFHIIGCLVMRFIGNEANANAVGLLCETGSVTGLNGSLVEGNAFESNGIGMWLENGAAGTAIVGNVFESNTGGGLLIQQSSLGLAIYGNYFEENTDHTTATQDLFIGQTSFCRGLDVRGNYFNGRAASMSYDYVPLRLGYIGGATIEENYINIGNRFVECTNNFASAANVLICNNSFGPTFDISIASTVYIIPNSFASNNNTISDTNFTVLGGGNFIPGDMPYAVTATLTGSSTWVKSNVVYAGRSAVGALTKTGSDTAYVGSVTTITATNNQDLRGKFVTFAVPAVAVGSTGLTLNLEVDFGSGATASIHSYTPLVAANGWQVYSITVAVPAAETSLTFYMQIVTTAGTFYLGKPVGFIGATLPTDWLYNAQPPYWSATAAPTTGTWAVGDIVWNSATAAGGTPGWVCTTAGTPGIWKAMANVAA